MTDHTNSGENTRALAIAFLFGFFVGFLAARGGRWQLAMFNIVIGNTNNEIEQE